MKVKVPALLLSLSLALAVTAMSAGTALAAIGGAASRHNMTDEPGYPFRGDVCAACHKPHYAIEKRLWTNDRTASGGGRDLAPAKAASLDQVAGPGDYPGIYLCLDCHGSTAGTPPWASAAAKTATHSTRELQGAGYNTKRGDFVVQCTECHDTHQKWDGTFGGGKNAYMIRSSIRGRKVVFTALSGAGSMGTNTAPYQAVCEVCHTNTKFHNRTGSQTHSDGRNCKTCHSHAGGFAATGCGGCHDVLPPGLLNHSVHITAAWGPKASCDNCHPAGSNNGGQVGHMNGSVDFKDGAATLTATTICNSCHGCTPATKPTWGDASRRLNNDWCEKCHDGSSTVNTTAGTGGVDIVAPDVAGDGVNYGFEVTGHGKTSISLGCVNCHLQESAHIDGSTPTYRSPLGNYQAGFRLERSNTVPLLGNYSSGSMGLCYYCHSESKIVGMPSGGKPSALHVHSILPADRWYTNFRNMSTVKGRYEGNYDDSSYPSFDVPTNIHWNHLDDYGSTRRFADLTYDSDRDGTGDSHITCQTCHNPHGTRAPAMVMDDFSLQTYSVTTNKAQNPTYRWLGSTAYMTSRCSVDICHFSGNGSGISGTKYYREPTGLGSLYGVPMGLTAVPLP